MLAYSAYERDGRLVDLQTNYSPFIEATRDNTVEKLNSQAEEFVGMKTIINRFTPDEQITDKTERPAVPMSLLNSSNQLFADYQPHNSNVFSTIDEMSYQAEDDVYRITSANVSYYVVGWHTEGAENPFFMTEGNEVKLDERMTALAMKLKDESTGGAEMWKGRSVSSDILCHGAMYDVKWSSKDVPPDHLAHYSAEMLSNKSPVAVGTTAAESLFSLIQSFAGDDQGDLKDLRTTLCKSELWFMITTKDLFLLWWKYMSGAIHGVEQDKVEQLKTVIKNQTVLWDSLQKNISDLKAQMKPIQNKFSDSIKKGTAPVFAQKRDPTLLVGGVQSG
ncbi:hypothetical protein B0O99DRAFT_603004 [Bisporella sp. PMI_857]|nr:hypothetical protein B0O99DRAFT_603004 [Bisporella sp. PMI_857]